MAQIEILKYVVYGYSFIAALIPFSLSDDLRNQKFFRRCLTAALVSLTIGITLEFTNSFDQERGMTLLLMSISIIYLGFYKILFKLFKVWKGSDPYITSRSSSIGGKPINGFWSKYPKGRKIIWTDFLFTFAQSLIPIFTIVGLMILLIYLNK